VALAQSLLRFSTMRLIQFVRRFLALFRKEKLDRDMAEEMRFHLNQRTADNVADGVPADEGRYAALRQFGNVASIQERAREQRGWAWLEYFVQDIGYGVSMLRKNPGFTTVAVLTLGLGIGANTAIFSFVNGVMLKPLPYADSDRIVRLTEILPEGKGYAPASPLNYLDWEKQNTVFDRLACLDGGGRKILAGVGTPFTVLILNVSAQYLDIFNDGVALGRTFAPGDDQPGNDQVVILTHPLWQSQFGADSQVIGRSISIDSKPNTVIGVLPQRAWDRVRLPNNEPSFIVFRPLAFTPVEKTRDDHRLEVYARLKPGVSIEQAQAQMDTISARLAHAYPESNKGRGIKVELFADTIVAAKLRQSLYLLLAAAGMVLLIACANIANLTLARGVVREREVAIRASLGAGRWRLVRQFLTESLLLSTGGSIFGLGVAWVSLSGLEMMMNYAGMLPAVATITMDGHVLLFTLILSVLTGVICGLAPALQATRPEAMASMKQAGSGLSAGRKRQRMRSVLVSIEVMLAFVLLTGAGLLLRSFSQLQKVDMRVADPANVTVAWMPIPDKRFSTPELFLGYFHQIVDRLRALPGVSDVALRDGSSRFFQIADKPPVDQANQQACDFTMVTPSYSRTLGERLIKGRLLNDRDVKGAAQVTVINETMARKYFPDEDPIGKRILIPAMPFGEKQLGREIPWEVVGVIADARFVSPHKTDDHLGVYVTIEQSPRSTNVLQLYIRSAIDPALLQQAIRNAVYESYPEQVVMNMTTKQQMQASFTVGDRFHLVMLGIFASIALMLAVIGIYGVVSYSVTQRTHEIGIRAALGANSGNIMGLVLRSGMAPVVLGLVIGLAGVFGLARFVSSLLFGVGEHDPMTIAAVALILAAVALIACYIPARRAAKVDPSVALRCE
jgi:putative ABC transport system permease protein